MLPSPKNCPAGEDTSKAKFELQKIKDQQPDGLIVFSRQAICAWQLFVYRV